MTISVTNTTNDTCHICHMDYTSIEREDTAKVVELACHHFYHLSCLSPWLSLNEKENRDLSCCYQCEASWVPKRSHPESITAEFVKQRLAEIEQNEEYRSQSEVIHCLAQLKPHCRSIATRLQDIGATQGSKESYEKLKNWVIENVQEKLRATACEVINEVVQGAQALRNLEQETRYWATIPLANWSTEMNKEGVSVYYEADHDQCRMRVSKDYIQRATYAYMYQNIHDIEKFEKNLTELEKRYDYDREVLDAIQDARTLHQTISDTIKKHASLPIDKIILPIEKLINAAQLSETSKRTIPSLIKEILFCRGALRTLNEETDRWKKESIDNWPTKLKEEGIYFFDQNNKVKRLDGETFATWVKATQRVETTVAVANEMIRKTVGFLATQFFNSLM